MKNILPSSAVPFSNVYTVDVTPDLAKAWLEAKPSSRAVSEPHVAELAAAMESGVWRTTHLGIAFAEDGSVLDGLHRLHAVIRSGKTVPMIVVVNEPPENASAIDNRSE